ncbi:MAG: putative ABC transporter permease [Oscillospiraceae bacterium]
MEPKVIYEILWMFIIYAFAGWCCEVAFAACNRGIFVNRGFLNGPVCPIYGFGVVFVVACLTPVKDNLLYVFFGSILITSALEFISGFILEKVFNDRWWDYSDKPFNLGGYVCLGFSILWGLACVILMYAVHPLVIKLIALISPKIGVWLLGFLYLIFALDVGITIFAMASLKARLVSMEKIKSGIRHVSDDLGEHIADAAIEASGKLNEGKQELSELRKKYHRTAETPSVVQRRILNNLPHIQQGTYRESFNNIKLSLPRRKQKPTEPAEIIAPHGKLVTALLDIFEARDPKK